MWPGNVAKPDLEALSQDKLLQAGVSRKEVDNVPNVFAVWFLPHKRRTGGELCYSWPHSQTSCDLGMRLEVSIVACGITSFPDQL